MSQTDTYGLTASLQAKTADGAKFYFSEVGQTDPATATWTWVEGMKAVNFPVPDKPEIDVTTTTSVNREFIAGKGTIPDWATSLDFYPKNSVHRRIMSEIAPSSENRMWKVEHPDFTIIVIAYIKGWPVSGNVDTQFTADLTLKVSGAPTIDYPAESGASIAWDNSLVGDEGTGAVTGDVLATMTVPSGSSIAFSSAVTGDFFRGVHYVATNVPAGLTEKVTKTSGTEATITFTGTATSTIDVSNVGISFRDVAFENALATDVAGSTKTDIAIIFA